VAGRPLLAWSLAAFGAASAVDRAVVAIPPELEGGIEALVPQELPVEVVAGGTTRSESVGAALRRVDAELVVVHDAARPLVTGELIDAVLAKLVDHPEAAGVIAAAPLTDTVKWAREPRPATGDFERGGPTIERTESRDHLWAAQTPQAFRAAALQDAHRADAQRVAAATDDAMLVEEAGGTVLIEPSRSVNLKVTTPADLRIAELLLGTARG
jgi:2-C-methyl-D-erythritol 4-phosphate cytidylyltransferase